MAPYERNTTTGLMRFERLFLKVTSLPVWASFSVSILVVAFSTWLLLNLQMFVAEYDGLKRGPVFIAFFFIAIAISTIIGGLNAGLFSVLLSLFCTLYFLMLPVGPKYHASMSNDITLAIVTIVGALVAIGMEGLRANTKLLIENVRLQQKEHNIAVQLQAALQPELDLHIPGSDVASYYRAALDEANVGGDFYDGFALGDGRYVLVVGDVSGKGLIAASQVSAIRNMLRCLLQTVGVLDDAVEQLNGVLIKQKLLPSFASLMIAVFNETSLMLEYVSCGHEPALLCHAGGDGSIELLEATAPVIGIFEESYDQSGERFFCSSIRQLYPGDALLLYTDGVCDAGIDTDRLLGVTGITGLVDEYFGKHALVREVDDKPPAKSLIEYCMDRAEKHTEGIFRDDVCLVALVVGIEAKRGGTHDAVERLRVAGSLKESTHGKLRVVESTEEFPMALSSIAEPIDLDEGQNIRKLRDAVRYAAVRAHLDKERIDALEVAAGEAANNSLLHAVGGTAQVSWTVDGVVQIKVWDRGPGIAYKDLPRVALEPGYTTSGTLGQGLKIVLESVDRCWIKTGEKGTTLVLEQFRGRA